MPRRSRSKKNVTVAAAEEAGPSSHQMSVVAEGQINISSTDGFKYKYPHVKEYDYSVLDAKNYPATAKLLTEVGGASENAEEHCSNYFKEEDELDALQIALESLLVDVVKRKSIYSTLESLADKDIATPEDLKPLFVFKPPMRVKNTVDAKPKKQDLCAVQGAEPLLEKSKMERFWKFVDNFSGEIPPATVEFVTKLYEDEVGDGKNLLRVISKRKHCHSHSPKLVLVLPEEHQAIQKKKMDILEQLDKTKLSNAFTISMLKHYTQISVEHSEVKKQIDVLDTGIYDTDAEIQLVKNRISNNDGSNEENSTHLSALQHKVMSLIKERENLLPKLDHLESILYSNTGYYNIESYGEETTIESE